MRKFVVIVSIFYSLNGLAFAAEVRDSKGVGSSIIDNQGRNGIVEFPDMRFKSYKFISPSSCSTTDGKLIITLEGNTATVDRKYQLDLNGDGTYEYPAVSLSNIKELEFTGFRHGQVVNTNAAKVRPEGSTTEATQAFSINETVQGIPPLVTINPVAKASICNGTPTELKVIGTGFTSFQWYRNKQIILGAISSSLSITQDGQYNVRVGVNDCSDTSDFPTIARLNPTPKADLPVEALSSTICEGLTTDITVAGSQVGVEYRLYKGASAIDTLVGNDSQITFNLPKSVLSSGNNTFLVKAVVKEVVAELSSIRSTGITLDGELNEPGWTLNQKIERSVEGGSVRTSVYFSSQWDDNYLYIGVKALDETPTFSNDPSRNEWDSDGIEIYLDGNNSKGSSYDNRDEQYIFPYGRADLTKFFSKQGK
ncbi:MAG TPA: sugar-binding protein, partial [Cytophagaceae bacterium]